MRDRRNARALWALAAMALLAACQSSRQRVAEHEDALAAAGFEVRPANTPERQTMLARLPAHKFIQRAKGDQVHYVYADPSVCKCLYVGTQKAYGLYQANRQTARRDKELKQELEDHDHAAEDDDFDAQIYSDPAWNWAEWGSWGPDFGYGPGPGW